MVGSLDKQNQKRAMKIAIMAVLFTAAGAVSIAAISSSLHGRNPLAIKSQSGSHLPLLVFLGVLTVLTIAVPGKFLEWQRTDNAERFAAASDSIAESQSRRELLHAIEMEIKRSNRTQRPFALLRIQVDDLNTILNERASLGSERVLSRLTQVLQSNCRELDTVVRYGSSEFAILLAEAGPETLGQVSRRIRQRLAGDHKAPSFSVRIGAAVFGADGKSIDTLLEAADPELYEVKRILDSETSLCA